MTKSPRVPYGAKRLVLSIVLLLAWAGTGQAVQRGAEVADPSVGGVLAEGEGCFDCHGVDGAGIGPTRPALAGQKEMYLYKQLLHFRLAAEGKNISGVMGRRHSVMGHNLLHLGNGDLRHLAAFFASLSCPDLVGEITVLRPPKRVRHCAACHGLEGRSRKSSIPNLAGQKEEYLTRQLRFFRYSERVKNRPGGKRVRSHPVMNKQAARLADTEIKALAAYFSSASCN